MVSQCPEVRIYGTTTFRCVLDEHDDDTVPPRTNNVLPQMPPKSEQHFFRSIR